MGELTHACLGWSGACLILNPIHIHWCQTCYKWGMANQDWWLLSV